MDRNKPKHSDDGYDFASKKVKQEGELEVTGVSRSGRVRKKSSKLTDFESLDEIDIRSNARAKKDKHDVTASPTISRTVKKDRLVKEELLSDVDETELTTASFPVLKPEQPFSEESENEVAYPPNEESSLESLVAAASEVDEIDEEEIIEQEEATFQPITADDSSDDGASQPRGLFTNEKASKKKLVIKEGKILGKAKTAKKDKGKSRISAYMLWAKEMRIKLNRENANLDFSQMSKKLGELWSKVPFHEKYMWKKRASRLLSMNKPPGNVSTRPGLIAQSGGGGGAGATTSVAAVIEQQQSTPASLTKKNKSSPTRRFTNKQTSQQIISNTSQVVTAVQAVTTVAESKLQSKSSGSSETSVFKPVNTSAMDVAAHLKLLGESLTIIGERLTEHEGQIAVSGSFSVLLDSLLCALGPLLCLTQQVPQMNVVPQEQLSQIMDNIAYIMPGI